MKNKPCKNKDCRNHNDSESGCCHALTEELQYCKIYKRLYPKKIVYKILIDKEYVDEYPKSYILYGNISQDAKDNPVERYLYAVEEIEVDE